MKDDLTWIIALVTLVVTAGVLAITIVLSDNVYALMDQVDTLTDEAKSPIAVRIVEE